MAVSRRGAEVIMSRLLSGQGAGERLKGLRPRLPSDHPLPPRVPAGNDHTTDGLSKRREALAEQGIQLDQLSGQGPEIAPENLAGNIENLIGFARIPVGVIGPLRVNGSAAAGDFYVPMATSEGALVASYNRGAYVISQSGGAATLCLTEAVIRAPCFLFSSMADAGAFLAWVLQHCDELQAVVSGTSRHCKLLDVQPTLAGKDVFLSFQFHTGDASGQNMVTLATEAVCRHLAAGAPVKPSHWFVEGNSSGDKKATMMAFITARGKKVVSEVVLRPALTKKILHVTPEDMLRYWHTSVIGGVQTGQIGMQGHYANALAAIFIACGQDAACVSEASTGFTRMELTPAGDLYVSVSLPNLIVGTVGGGTHLPTARECLAMMDCVGENRARKLAEICAATALAGEISIIAALAAGEFAGAHAQYGRKRANATR